MKRFRSALVVTIVLTLVAIACGTGDDGSGKWVVSPRVVAFSIDQATTMPALDRIALRPGS
jgi:hypothetical protein